MNELTDIQDYLRQPASRDNSARVIAEVRSVLAHRKSKAVDADDQVTAKRVWCYEQTLAAQSTYLQAFVQMKKQYFYSGWCLLDRTQITISHLEKHFPIKGDDPYQLSFMEEHAQKFMSLFPYKLFFSPAYLIKEKKCSICDAQISLSASCGHRKGEIYNGEQCAHKITEAAVLEISMVFNPGQRYSVPFFTAKDDAKTTDHYNYAGVDYVVQRLRSPFDGWDVEILDVLHPHELFDNTSQSDPCPCGSAEPYASCCYGKEGVKFKHRQISFYVDPPKHLPQFEYNRFVAGKLDIPKM